MTKEDLNQMRGVMKEVVEEVVAPRFEKIDERFEKIDERFDEVDKRFGELEERMKKYTDTSIRASENRVLEYVDFLQEKYYKYMDEMREDIRKMKQYNYIAQMDADEHKMILKRIQEMEERIAWLENKIA